MRHSGLIRHRCRLMYAKRCRCAVGDSQGVGAEFASTAQVRLFEPLIVAAPPSVKLLASEAVRLDCRLPPFRARALVRERWSRPPICKVPAVRVVCAGIGITAARNDQRAAIQGYPPPVPLNVFG